MEALPNVPARSSRVNKSPKSEHDQENGKRGKGVKRKQANGSKKSYVPSYVLGDEKCEVCGDISTGMHYRVFTCEGCKGFFRRTTQKSKGQPPNLTCKKEGNCDITPLTRNSCQFCRYQKCRAKNMDTASVLNEVARKNLQGLIANNRNGKLLHKRTVLSKEEMSELHKIAKNYKSQSFHTFFSFNAEDRETILRSQKSPLAVSPAVLHAINFVRNIPGVQTIHADDLAVLMYNRLVDVLALLMAEVFNVTNNILCFCDFQLQEIDLDMKYPKMKSIFKYAQFYSRFLSDDGMILACLCATRFLNSDGLQLTQPEKVDQALDKIQNLSVKYWSSLKNKRLVRDLLKGLPNFENIRDEELSVLMRISMLEKNFEDIKSHIQSNPLSGLSESSTPEYVNQSTSSVPSSGSFSISPSNTSEEDVKTLKQEVKNDDLRSNQSINIRNGNVNAQPSFEIQFQPQSFQESVSHDVTRESHMLRESDVSASALFGGNSSWHVSGGQSDGVTSSTICNERWTESTPVSQKIIPVPGTVIKPEARIYSQQPVVSTSVLFGSTGSVWPAGVNSPCTTVTSSATYEDRWSDCTSLSNKMSETTIKPEAKPYQATSIRNNGYIHQQCPETYYYQAGSSHSSQDGFSRSTHALPPETHNFKSLRSDDHMPITDNRRMQVPRNILCNWQDNIGAPVELVDQDDDVDNLKKKNESLKKMVLHLCDVMKTQGVYPNLDSMWDIVQRTDIATNMSRSEMAGMLKFINGDHQSSPIPSFPHELSILHHPEVSRALSSRQLSFAHTNDYRMKCHSLTSPLGHQYYPSSSSASQSSFTPSPVAYQNVSPVCEIDSEPFRFQTQNDQFSQQTNGHSGTFWQVQHYADNRCIFSSNVTQDPIEPSFSFRSQTAHSSTSNSSPQSASREPIDHSFTFRSQTAHSSTSNYSPQSATTETTEPSFSFRSQTPHSSTSNSSPVSLPESSSPFDNVVSSSESKVICQPQTHVDGTAPPKSPTEAICFKKKWLRAHFNEEGLSLAL